MKTYMKVKESASVSGSVVSDLLRPQALYPARLLCPWNPPGKNTGVGCHFLLQGLNIRSSDKKSEFGFLSLLDYHCLVLTKVIYTLQGII